jgi:hypothetical protein
MARSINLLFTNLLFALVALSVKKNHGTLVVDHMSLTSRLGKAWII